MKRSIQALIMMETGAVIVAMAIFGPSVRANATPVAHTVAPVVKLTGSAALTTVHGGLTTAAKFHVHATFSTDTPGAPLFTIQQAVIFFPDHAGTNGRLFPSCGARQIERLHGDVGRCPEGSQIGSGTLKARALQLGITAAGRVTMFNSRHGKSITFNIQTAHPALINRSIDAPITQLHGKYGEKLTLVVPHSLQEIISGSFVGIRDFDVTIGGAVRRRGVDYSFLKARTCPRRAMHGVFDFENWATGQMATTTADAKVRCRVR
ncbi:MAG TPA: hypothetical protein VE972_09535 [Conexibacter sp.]|nr:hypothetical protein [Conexibacter sp.]